MPRTVDHDERRAQIAGALNRIAGRDGLRAVTMRAVAAEAGVSVRLVQYYFGTKAELLTGAVRELERASRERWQRRLDPGASPRAFFETFLDEALPDDPPSRAFTRAFHGYTDLMLSDPAFTTEAPTGPSELEARFAATLAAAGVPDSELEAPTLLLLSHGLCASVLIGARTPAAARALWARQLDRLDL